VYGGGGIMPDYFVPLDTSLYSNYLNDLLKVNAVFEYSFNYASKNKASLEKMGLQAFIKSFVVTDAMLKDLTQLGERKKIKPNYTDLKKQKKLFQLQVKAQIARRVWGNDGLYPILNETNEVLQQAVKLFDRIPELSRTKM
jgi:carboxyl-terminal processing protease